MKQLTDEERQELQVLNAGAASYITKWIDHRINILTPKALIVKLAESERLVTLSGIDQLNTLKQAITERHTSLKKRMEEESNGR